MIRLRSLVTGTVVTGLLVAGTAFAQGPRSGGPGGPGRQGGAAGRGLQGGLALQALDLTDAQQQQVRGIREQYREDVRAAGEQVRLALEAQRAAVEAIPLNEGGIRATAQNVAAAQAEAAVVEARIHNDVWAVLTPAQQEKAAQLRAQRADRLQQRQGNQRQRLQKRRGQ